MPEAQEFLLFAGAIADIERQRETALESVRVTLESVRVMEHRRDLLLAEIKGYDVALSSLRNARPAEQPKTDRAERGAVQAAILECFDRVQPGDGYTLDGIVAETGLRRDSVTRAVLALTRGEKLTVTDAGLYRRVQAEG